MPTTPAAVATTASVASATAVRFRRTNLAAAIGNRVGPGADRFVPQVAAQIVGQRRDRGVALRGFLLQRLRDNRVEVSAQQPA